MRYRSTILYLLVAVILLGFYLYESGKEEKEQKARDQGKKVFLLNPEEMTSISLKREDMIILVEKSGVSPQETWEISGPIRAAVDRFALNGLRNRISGLQYSRLVFESTDDLAQFGLEKPSLVISFRTVRGEGSLSIGSKSPVDNGFFARKDQEKRVLLVASYDKQELDKGLFDLRDKKVLTLETDKVDRVVLDGASGKWVLYRIEDRWYLEGKQPVKLQRDKVEAMIRPILWTDALSFEKEQAEDLAPFGLHKPKARVLLSYGSRAEEILLGNDAKAEKGGAIYATIAGKPQVVTVQKRILEALPKDPTELVEEKK